LLMLALAALAGSFRRFEPRITIFVAIGLVLLLTLASLAALRFGLWLDPSPAIIALMLLFPAWGWQRLSVANRLIGKQLAVLRDDSGILSRPMVDDPAVDRVSSQLAALETGIERSIDLRRFIQSSFDSLPDPAVVVQDDGTIALVNTQAKQAFEHYCGFPIPEKIVDAMSALVPHIQSDYQMLVDALHANAAQSFELRLQDDRHFQAGIGYFQNAQGESFAIIRLSELTALRRAQQLRQNALEFLSHDLRSPQSSMISLIDGHPGDIETSLAGRIRALATRTLQLAQSFVDISRVQAGSYSATEIDLHDIVQEALDSLWPDLKAKGLKVVSKTPEDETIVSADQLLLFRAITNLIHNAIKYSPQNGEIGVTIRARKGANDLDGWVCMIDDHGPGVERADQSRIFERFQSGSHATGGVGLGLSLVAAVATGFGGTVRCVSRPKVGSRFVVWLPKLS
jgi:signal transduction histidine kinase